MVKKVKAVIGDVFLRRYALLFSRPFLRDLNRVFLHLGLRGLGILNYQDFVVSGERHFARQILSLKEGQNAACIFDVGAHDGEYAQMIIGLRQGGIDLHCFEPSPVSFVNLSNLQKRYVGQVIANNFGLSDAEGDALLYEAEDISGSQLASLYSQGNGSAYTVALSTGDLYCEENEIRKIDLLKIDVEGHELAVLRGFGRMLSEGRINAIQFEFNTTNESSRTALKDFESYLDGYRLYRLLPKGRVMRIGAIDSSIYLYQNIVALRV